jgi:predicted PurR-regulated permease PerM
LVNSPRSPWSGQTKTLVGLLLVVFFIYLLSRFQVVIPPLVIAIIWAYIVSPVARFFHKRTRLHRVLAVLLANILFLAIITSLLMLLIPTLASQFTILDLDVQQYMRQARTLLGFRVVIGSQVIDLPRVLDEIQVALRGFVQPIIGQTLNIAMGIITSVIWVVFIFIVSFYLVRDSDNLNKWVEGLIPDSILPDFIWLRNEIGGIWSAFFRGQLVLGLVVAAIITVAGLILGLPLALAMGILAGLLEFLPSIGHGIWLILAASLALLTGSTWIPIPNWAFMLLVIGFHFVFQQFDLNYLIPRIIGRSVHLPPLVVILGIVAGAVTAGILGIPLAAPTIASARVLGRYIHANLLDLPPYPASTAHLLPPPDPYWWRRLRPRKSTQGDSDTP